MISVGTLAAFGLYLVRTSALLLASPLLGNGAAFSGYKVALVALVSFALFSATGAPRVDLPLTPEKLWAALNVVRV